MDRINRCIFLVTACLCWSLAMAGNARADGPITEFVIPTEGHWPQGIVTGPDGNLWVTESRKRKIIRITPDGKITDFTVPGDKVLLLQGIAAGADGNIWFTSPSENAIRRITPKGEVNGDFKIPTTSGSLANAKDTSFPRGMGAGPDGNIWFAELGASKIGRITPKGEFTEFPLPTPNSGPYNPVFDKAGNV